MDERLFEILYSMPPGKWIIDENVSYRSMIGDLWIEGLIHHEINPHPDAPNGQRVWTHQIILKGKERIQEYRQQEEDRSQQDLSNLLNFRIAWMTLAILVLTLLLTLLGVIALYY